MSCSPHREREIPQLLAEGRTSTEVANLLYLSRYTAKTHLTHIFQKLNDTPKPRSTVWRFVSTRMLKCSIDSPATGDGRSNRTGIMLPPPKRCHIYLSNTPKCRPAGSNTRRPYLRNAVNYNPKAPWRTTWKRARQIRAGDCPRSLHVADLDEDLVAGSGSVRDRLRARLCYVARAPTLPRSESCLDLESATAPSKSDGSATPDETEFIGCPRGQESPISTRNSA